MNELPSISNQKMLDQLAPRTVRSTLIQAARLEDLGDGCDVVQDLVPTMQDTIGQWVVGAERCGFDWRALAFLGLGFAGPCIGFGLDRWWR